MNKRQAERYTRINDRLRELGFTNHEIDQLFRAEKTLGTWAEHECNGEIQRDEETNIPYWHSTYDGRRLSRTADRETGALKRVKAICESHGCQVYHQGDPRGCTLYVITPGSIPEGCSVDSCYTNGIAMCL